MRRDFTYIGDIVEGSYAYWRCRNRWRRASRRLRSSIGNHTSIELETFISELERLSTCDQGVLTCSRATTHDYA
jgi:hypothetical protein